MDSLVLQRQVTLDSRAGTGSETHALRGVGTTRFSFFKRLNDQADRSAWEEFHKRYGIALYRYARQQGASHNDAEDIVQELELNFLRALDGFRYDRRRGRFRGYLLASVSRLLRRFRSKRSRGELSIDPFALSDMADLRPSNAGGSETQRTIRLRASMLAVNRDFDPITLEAFRQYAIEGRPAAKTAEALQLDVASVYQAKSRVMKRLREHLCE